MVKRRINAELFRSWIEKNPRVVPLLIEGGISLSTFDQMKRGVYSYSPKSITRRLMCKITKLAEDDLFPVIDSEEAS